MSANTFMPSNNSYTSANGIGQYYGSNASSAATVRSGDWYLAARAGIYNLSFGMTETTADKWVGFRCVYR